MMRLDYFVLSRSLRPCLRACAHADVTSKAAFCGSDHCPLALSLGRGPLPRLARSPGSRYLEFG